MFNLRSVPFRVFAGFSVVTMLLWASGVTQQAYNLIQGNGTPATQETTANFVDTATVAWTVSTVSGVTQIQATSSAGGSGNPTITVANAAITGTTAGTLTKLNGVASSTAVIAATTDTGGVAGITTAGAGTTGNAVITIAGLVNCAFDGATTVNDYVQISSSTGGDCTDAGATYPTSNQVIGRVTSTNLASGTYQIDLFPSEIKASSGGGGSFIQPLTAPVSASFSQLNFNQGGTTTVQTNNSTPVTSITISQSDPSDNEETAALVKNKIAATFTVTVGVSITLLSGGGVGGIFLYDGSAKNLFWGIQNSSNFRAPAF